MLQAALDKVLPTMEGKVPKEVVDTAQNFCFQSRNKMAKLKPEEEPARQTVCAHLAVEKHMEKLNLPYPSTKQAPVPSNIYKKLLEIFRKQLVPNSSQSSPGLKTPTKPKAHTEPLDSSLTATPTSLKRKIVTTNGSPIKTSPSPSKRQRGGPKSTDPRAEDIERACEKLGIEAAALDAIAYGYRQYNNLVKDRWGLLCGLIYVIGSKAQPSLVFKQRVPFSIKVSHSVPYASEDKVEEWIQWAEKIVGDQSWVKQVTAPEMISANTNNDAGLKKYSSGVGNMIKGPFWFTNPTKIENYKKWKLEIYTLIEQQEQN